MAEERFIDDDKDRKYKIRINEDGEEELVIDDSPEETAEEEIPVFAVPELDGDDEEAADLTPEQLAERQRQKEEEQRALDEKVSAYLAGARASLAEGNYESALFSVNKADELKENDGGINCLKLLVLTRNFNDFTTLGESAQVAEKVKEFASAEQKAELAEKASGLKARIAQTGEECEKLNKENEEKKAERRVFFAEERKKATKKLLVAGVPFLVFLILAISFASVIFSMQNGVFVALTAVFSALALITFIVSAVMLHGFWTAQRNYGMNEKDKFTKLGRKYLEVKGELEKLNKINSALGN